MPDNQASQLYGPSQKRRRYSNVPSAESWGTRTRFIGENTIRCEGPGCANFVPAGFVEPRQKRFFCSDPCDWRYYNKRHVIGVCKFCGGPTYGTASKVLTKKYCSRKCDLAATAERTLGQTGPFRPIVENYLEGTAKNHYADGTLPRVKGSLWLFFDFVFNTEHITRLEDIRCSTVTKFIAAERARGRSSGNYIGDLSTFFRTLQAEGLVDMASPVIPYKHSQKNSPCAPRPFTDAQADFFWSLLEASNATVLKLAFALGEECGLRIGEVANIRLEDIDREKQTVYVRLPTKNKRPRTVPFHNKVSRYYDLWLKERDPRCQHDGLLHTVRLAFFRTSSLDDLFKSFYDVCPETDTKFLFHRLRHTWATRLMNNGMELAVLKELGGWVSWNSMQGYIKVLDATVQRQYAESYKKLQEHGMSGAEVMIPLADFARMKDGAPVSA